MRQARNPVFGSAPTCLAFLVFSFLVSALPALAAGTGPLPLPALANSLPDGFIAAGPAGGRLPGAPGGPRTGFNAQIRGQAGLVGWGEPPDRRFSPSRPLHINTSPTPPSPTTPPRPPSTP